MKNMIVHVEGLGKIKKADIEIAPMLFFIGDNNSGKSYLMTLLYGLANISIGQYLHKNKEEVQNCCKLIKQRYASRDQNNKFKISKEEFLLFVNLLNTILETEKEKIISNVFNKEISIGKLSLDIPDRNWEITVSMYDQDEIDISLISDKKKFRYIISRVFAYPTNNIDIDIYMKTVQTFLEVLLVTELPKPLFLPVSRTGFMLTYKTLSDRSIEDKFNNIETKKNLLTRPESDFIKQLSSLSIKKKENLSDKVSIIRYIEEEIINGHIKLLDFPSNEIKYIPNNKEEIELPLYLTSGVITEIAPLLVFLNSNIDFNLLMMEEPEMCMHPELQKKVARLLIRIVNSGIPIMVTTHSDIILQHINSMIRLDKNSKKQVLLSKYGYDEQDLICFSDVRVYQFKLDKELDTTIVENIEGKEYGFSLKTFTNALEDMLEQIKVFSEEEEN